MSQSAPPSAGRPRLPGPASALDVNDDGTAELHARSRPSVSAAAERRLIGASVYRERVDRYALRWRGEQSPRRAGWLDELASIGRPLGWSSLGLIAEQAEPAAAPGPPGDAEQPAAAGRPQ